jgi:hypothetical protein
MEDDGLILKLGTAEGCDEKVGTALGRLDSLGTFDGILLGLEEEISLGMEDGEDEGNSLGSVDGIDEGAKVGVRLGIMLFVGDAEGTDDNVGRLDG